MCTPEEIKGVKDNIKQKLESGFEEAKSYKVRPPRFFFSLFEIGKLTYLHTDQGQGVVGVQVEQLQEIVGEDWRKASPHQH